MRKIGPTCLTALVLLGGCGEAPSAAPANQVVAANVTQAVAPGAPDCLAPKLDFAASGLDSGQQSSFAANFAAANAKACGEGLYGSQPLIDPHSAKADTIFVMDAPEANVVSIYFRDDPKPAQTLVEVPFGSPKTIPAAEDFHEAIYCAVHGATPKEEEESGRCLPD